jgi:type II secretory pathway component PulL
MVTDDEGDGEIDRSAAEYWKSLAAKGGGTSDPAGALSPRAQRWQKLKGAQALAPIEDDSGGSTDPLVLIVEAIRENSDAIKAATAEMTAARLAMVASETQHAQRANTMARDMSTVTHAVNQLTASETAKKQRRSDWMFCVLAGVVIGVILAAFAILDLPMLWHNLFG